MVYLVTAARTYLEGANGGPVQATLSGPMTGTTQTTLQLSLDEIVTRADGTKMSVMELLDAIAGAAQAVSVAAASGAD